MEKHNVGAGSKPAQIRDGLEPSPTDRNLHSLSSQIIRQIILPQIEKEVNTAKNFTQLRQMFYSMILASWYKMQLKNAVLAQIYGNQSKVMVGINQQDPNINEEIFERYLQAYKKGVFNFIKDDLDVKGGETVPRKYFSGGVVLNKQPNIYYAMLSPGRINHLVLETVKTSPAQLTKRREAALEAKARTIERVPSLKTRKEEDALDLRHEMLVEDWEAYADWYLTGKDRETLFQAAKREWTHEVSRLMKLFRFSKKPKRFMSMPN